MKNEIFKKNYLNKEDAFKTLENYIEYFFPKNFLNFGKNSELFVMPLTELKEDESNYYLEIDLPGVKKEDIKIKIDGNFLQLSGTREDQKEKNKFNYHFEEITKGSFSRNYYLKEEIDAEKIKANYEEGVLKIKIPKSTRKKGEVKNIVIE